MLLYLLIATLLFISLVLVLLPPDSNDWDGMAYHLAVPKLYLEHGGIYSIPFIHHSNFPALLEMLFTWGLWASGFACAKAFHWWMWVLTLVGTFAFIKQGVGGARGERQKGKSEREQTNPNSELAVLMLVATPISIWEAGIAYVDLSTALYTALGAFALYRGLKEKIAGWLWAGGILLGFALGTKYTALLSWGLLGLLGLGWLVRSQWREGWRPLIGAGILALLIGCPWYIKTYLYTGNPVYPFAYEVFGARNWSPENAALYREAQLQFGLGDTPAEKRSLTQLLMMPWNVTTHPAPFMDPVAVKIGDHFYLLGILGGTYLAGLFLLSAGGLPAGAGWLGLFALGSTLGWFFLAQQVRYLLPILPILAVLTTWSFGHARRWLRWLFGGLVLLQTAYCLWLYGMSYMPFLPVAFGMGDPGTYLNRKLDLYPAIQFINQQTPEDAKIILYDEVRGYYLERDYLWGNPGHHTLIPYDAFHSAQDLIAFLKNAGYTHVLINRRFTVNSQEKWSLQLQEAIETGLLNPVFSERGVEVYEIAK